MSALNNVESQTYYLLLIQSSTGKLNDMLLPAPKELDPESFAKAILSAYKLESSKFKRLYYRCVLFKKPVVSIVTLSKATNFPSGSNLKPKVATTASAEDQTLTSSMKDPSVLSNINPESFFNRYEAVVADIDGRNAPERAIMIHLVKDDKLAAQVTGGIVTLAVSVFAKLLDSLVTGS